MAAEVVLRYKYGFLSAPLYVASPDYEYVYAPNQEIVRFGNTIRTNSYSMRNDPIDPSDTTVVLLVGDSVVNGGSLTDQDSLASTLLEKRLTQALGGRVRVLNISAGSWGPDNVAAYLKKYGLFNADLMCLVASSHDAHDIMGHEPIVGIDPNLPDKQFDWALQELWVRYEWMIEYMWETKVNLDNLLRYIEGSANFAPLPDKDRPTTGIVKNGEGFNPGFMELAEIAQQNNIPFFIFLHPETLEIEQGDYNNQGKEIIQFAQQNDIRLIKELEAGASKAYYRRGDLVHYNSSGQLFLANQLYPLFLNYLSPSH